MVHFDQTENEILFFTAEKRDLLTSKLSSWIFPYFDIFPDLLFFQKIVLNLAEKARLSIKFFVLHFVSKLLFCAAKLKLWSKQNCRDQGNL